MMSKTTMKPYELTEYDRKFNVYYRSFPMHIKHSGYYIYEYYMSYYALLLIIIGSTCNLTSFFVSSTITFQFTIIHRTSNH